MRLQSFITVNFTTETPKQVKKKKEKGKSFTFLLFTFYFSRSMSLCLCGVFVFFASPVLAQRVAVLTPEQTPQTQKYASLLADSLSDKFKILEDSMSWAAFRSVKLESPFNLTTSQGKAIGEVVGCDYFLLVRSGTIRRSSFAKDEFYESFVTVFLVNGRSGRLVYWDLKSFDADSQVESERLLFASSGSFAGKIIEQIEIARQNGLTVVNTPAFEEVPEAGSTDAKNFRPPMPYKRIKPEYTRKAYLYDVRATVDVMVDIDQNGAIAAVEIERWAGFGLDESVIETVRKMNWRPATRNGKTLPMRVLLRYNFTKIEKE
jgi:TonB family protein